MPNIVNSVFHLMIAFLCIRNRSAVMKKKQCDEWVLFENPKWLLEHYFEYSGIVLTDSEKEELFDFIESRNGKQIAESFLCPVNRHATREEHKCSDEDFVVGNNYNRLIMHYLQNGGAKAFALKRKEIKGYEDTFSKGG